MHKYPSNSTLPVKKKEDPSLSIEDKAHHKALSKQRISIEPINRRCKIFRVHEKAERIQRQLARGLPMTDVQMHKLLDFIARSKVKRF